jgi:IS5 family transposase
VWADSAYRSAEAEQRLAEKGYRSRIHKPARRNRPLNEKEKSANTARSSVRARVEHVFGHQENTMGRKIVRTIGIVRACVKVGMMNLVYNMGRLVTLERMATASA